MASAAAETSTQANVVSAASEEITRNVQTVATGTEEIDRKIQAFQTDTKGAVDAIEEIAEVINRINDISTTIAGAVEEQTATTMEIGRNVSHTAKGSGELLRI